MIRKTATGFPQGIMPDEEWKGQHNPLRAKGNRLRLACRGGVVLGWLTAKLQTAMKLKNGSVPLWA
jgi:hypothetical protein